MDKRVGQKVDREIARLRERRWTAREAGQVLSAWESSGGSMAAFARRHGLTAQRIAWWRERLGGREGQSPKRERESLQPAVRFVPALVRDVAGAAGREAAVTIRVRNDVEVEILDTARVPAEWLSAVIRRYEELAP